MVRRAVAAISSALLLVGCAGLPPLWEPPRPDVHEVLVSFDEAEARRLLLPGPSTIVGTGFLRQQGGGVVTCAGREVMLIPVTSYADARMSRLYGSVNRGFRGPARRIEFRPDPPSYATLSRSTRCNAQGAFRFEQVGAGDFYLVTLITWTVQSVEGGFVMQRVTVQPGQSTVEAVLSP